MKKTWKLLLALALVVSLCGGCAYLPLLGLVGGTSGADLSSQVTESEDGDTVTISKELYEQYKKYDTLIELQKQVDQYYYQETDEQTMLDGAAQGLLLSLGDPYTFYYTPEEYAKLWEDDEGSYAGVGMQISGSYATGVCTISRVFDGSPAQAAGVHRGDILRKVEDLDVNVNTLNDAVDIMRGTPGTKVTVVMERNGEEITFELERQTVTVNWVESCMLSDKVGYVHLYQFAGDCATQFESALKSMVEQGAKGLVLDLRDNPGGWVNDAVSIADHFLDKGIVCYMEYKDGTREYEYSKDGKENLALVVLVNEFSASSSEILSGALQDRADATIVGVQSYGKGIVQYVLPVGTDGAGMQLTVAQYYTPNGNAVHKIGITPDVEIALPEGDNGMYELGDLADPQLNKAFEVMQEKLEKKNSDAEAA